MDFYFVYSAGGGAGDWGGVNRIFQSSMPSYFKDHILIKFGDIFFNHRSQKSIIKPKLWNSISNAKEWLVGNTGDASIMGYNNLMMDVGTTKIVSYITSFNTDITVRSIVSQFDRILNDENILDKYCSIIQESNIQNAVTFDIPNLFKVRTQSGNISRDLFSNSSDKSLLIDACIRYANEIYRNSGRNANKLLTIISATWDISDIEYYLSRLDYTPKKIGIGGLTDYKISLMGQKLNAIDGLINFDNFSKVHFLGCGGLAKAMKVKSSLGNRPHFSVDNTTPYNRSIDGSIDGSAMSGYYDYKTKKLIRINSSSYSQILDLHRRSEAIAYFSLEKMEEILNGILAHQSMNSSQYTYECRAKLIIHNFDVYKYNAQ